MPVLRKVRAVAALAVLTALVLPGGVPGAAPRAAADPQPTPAPGGDGALSQTIEPEQDVDRGDAELAEGHVDLGPRLVDGAWELFVHDDSRAGRSVWRPLEHAVVRVADTALQTVPDDAAYSFLGVAPGRQVHVVPQTQDPAVVWLGWNTQDPAVLEAVDRGVTLGLSGVEGPGELVVYLQDGGFGAPDVLWDSRESGPQDLWVDVNTHTHANWVFTEPGVHLVTITARAAFVDGSEVTTTGTLRFAVGDDADAAEALAAEAPATDPGAPADADAEAGGEESAADATSGGTTLWLVVVGLLAAGLAAALAAVLLRGRRVRAGAEQ